MAGQANNLGPISLSVAVHAVLLTAMVAAFDIARPMPLTPMVVQATLVQEIPNKAPPPPTVEKQPEPVVDEVLPELDNSEELRHQEEEEKRIQDALIEEDRLEKLRKQEEVDRKKKEREEAERKKKEEEDKERERQEAERKRQEDIQRQRDENERLRKDLEADQRAEEIEDEERRMAANDSPAMAAYQFAIAQKIRRNWSVPASASPDTVCVANVRQLAGGEIVGVTIISCNGDEAVKRSVEAAIHRSSPLPRPSDPDLFRPLLELNLRPEQQN